MTRKGPLSLEIKIPVYDGLRIKRKPIVTKAAAVILKQTKKSIRAGKSTGGNEIPMPKYADSKKAMIHTGEMLRSIKSVKLFGGYVRAIEPTGKDNRTTKSKASLLRERRRRRKAGDKSKVTHEYKRQRKRKTKGKREPVDNFRKHAVSAGKGRDKRSRNFNMLNGITQAIARLATYAARKELNRQVIKQREDMLTGKTKTVRKRK